MLYSLYVDGASDWLVVGHAVENKVEVRVVVSAAMKLSLVADEGRVEKSIYKIEITYLMKRQAHRPKKLTADVDNSRGKLLVIRIIVQTHYIIQSL